MMETAAGSKQGTGRTARTREPGVSLRSARLHKAGGGAKRHEFGSLTTSMREVVRETVYATFDALRGRYDR